MYLKEKPQCRQAIGLGACPVEGDREEEDTCRESSYVVARRVSEKKAQGAGESLLRLWPESQRSQRGRKRKCYSFLSQSSDEQT